MPFELVLKSFYISDANILIILSVCLLSSQIRRSIAKLELYRKFTNSLAISVLLSVAWIGYEVVF